MILSLIVAGAGWACGTGAQSTVGPAEVVEGKWSYRATLSGADDVCGLSGAELSITQDGRDLAGSVSDFSLRCSDGEVCRAPGGTLEGTVSGSLVTFTALGLNHSGEVMADIMEGPVSADSLAVQCEDGRTLLLEGRGEWFARR